MMKAFFIADIKFCPIFEYKWFQIQYRYTEKYICIAHEDNWLCSKTIWWFPSGIECNWKIVIAATASFILFGSRVDSVVWMQLVSMSSRKWHDKSRLVTSKVKTFSQWFFFIIWLWLWFYSHSPEPSVWGWHMISRCSWQRSMDLDETYSANSLQGRYIVLSILAEY